MKHTVNEFILKNGARGLLIDVPSASAVSFLFNFRAGDRYASSRNKTEAAHLMEHMVLGANQRIRSARAFTAELQKNGAYANASTGRVQMTYDALCPVFEWERVFGLLQEAITQPLFSEEEFQAEWGNVAEEFRGYLNNHSRALWQRLDQATGGTVPTDAQRLKLMKNVNLRDVRNHYKKTHTASNMRFIIAGPVASHKEKIIRSLERWELPVGERLDWTEDTPTTTKPVYVNRKGVDNIFYNFQWAMPKPLTPKEVDVLACANHILAGTLFSRILGDARERGLAYHLWADQYTQATYSISEYGGQVSPANAMSLLAIAAHHIEELSKGKLVKQEILDAHDYTLGKVQMGYQTVSSIQRFYSDNYFFDGTIENFFDIPKRIQAVTKNQVVDAMRYMLGHGQFGFAAMSYGQKDLTIAMSEPLAALSPSVSEI